MSRRPVPTLRQTERALVRVYLATRGRGKQWRKVRRAVDAFVLSAAARRMLRVIAFGSAMGALVMRDLKDGRLDGFVSLLAEVIRRV